MSRWYNVLLLWPCTYNPHVFLAWVLCYTIPSHNNLQCFHPALYIRQNPPCNNYCHCFYHQVFQSEEGCFLNEASLLSQSGMPLLSKSYDAFTALRLHSKRSFIPNGLTRIEHVERVFIAVFTTTRPQRSQYCHGSVSCCYFFVLTVDIVLFLLL